jgi:hypothetical protein
LTLSSSADVFYGLNAVRALSIVALLLAFASSIVTIVSDVRAVNRSQSDSHSDDGTCGYIEYAPVCLTYTYELHADPLPLLFHRGSTVPNQPAGVFWAVVNRLFIIFQLVFLLLSEISWPMAFFDRFFPVLGSQFGLGSLGIFQGLCVFSFLSLFRDHRS